jgi:hypothetical protein
VDAKMTRREMVKRSLFLGAATAALGAGALGGGLLGSGCGGGELNCNNTAGLSSEDIATRTSNQYVERTMDAGKKCSGCNFYQGPAEGACGQCTVVKGPINPGGYCRLWVPKA